MTGERSVLVSRKAGAQGAAWECRVGGGAGAVVVNCSALVEAVWGSYSARVWNRFQKTFPKEHLVQTGFPSEIIENHLLLEIYSPRAFPALLTEQLSQRLVELAGIDETNQTSARGWLLNLPPIAGEIEELAQRLQRSLQASSVRSEQPLAGGNWKSTFTAWAGLLLGFGEILRGVGRLGLAGESHCDLEREPLPPNVFVLFNGTGNHTRHVWRFLESAPIGLTHAAVLLLGHRPLDSELGAKAKALGLRVVAATRRRHIFTAGWRLIRGWPRLQALQSKAALDLGLNFGLRFQAQVAVWWLRAFLHEACLAAAAFETMNSTIAVFGLIAHADSRMADLVLRQRGIKTVHWVHGIVEDSLHYRANATVCLCQTPGDAALRTQHGNYQTCLAPPSPAKTALTPPEIPTARDGLLVVTNLIHPDNRFIRAGAPEALKDLLQLVADCAGRRKIAPLTWRPHPRESVTPEFSRFRLMAEQLGYRVDNSESMASQVNRHAQIVSTFSGSIGDIAGLGKVPTVYAGLPYELDGHWSQLPPEIKFRTAAELDSALNNLRATAKLKGLLNHLNIQYAQPAPVTQSLRATFEVLRSLDKVNR